MSKPHADNPAFINDDGKSNYRNSFTPVINSTESLQSKSSTTHIIELKDLRKAEEATGDYDPYLHREVEHPTTNTETLLHLLKGSLGTGILSMPLAFYHSGYLLGFICTIMIGAICTHCIHLMIQAEYELCKRKKIPSMTYPQTAEAALSEGPWLLQKFAPYAPVTVNIFLMIYQLGTCCVYTVFIAENFKHVADQYMTELDLKVWMVIILLPLILINYVRNLKYLAPFSTVANFVTIVGFGIIFYYLIRNDITFEDREPVGNVRNFPLFFGTVLFALEAIGVIMPLENEMKTPQGFGSICGVLNIGMSFIVFLYAGLGLLGYLAYGSEVADTITLSLPKDDLLAQSVKIMLALTMVITHSIQMYVAIDLIWGQYLSVRFEKNRFQLLIEYTVRTGLVLVTFALAVAVPKLDLFISLFGAFTLSALGLAFPALIEIGTFWHQLTGVKGTMILSKNVAIIVFGVVGFVVGTYTSLENIFKYFSE